MNLLHIINLVGGLALFLFGINKMSDSLQAVAGSEMRRILKVLINTPLKGVLVGLGVTVLIQSSSATTVMMIGLVNTGIMTLNQAVGVVMGANIGTTITAQLIAFNIGQYAFLFVILGVTLLFIRKSKTMEHWSQILIGFGLLFVGLNVMGNSVSPLQNSITARNLMIRLASNPILSVLVGTCFTMLIQSSSASIGIVMVLASTGLIPFEGALYLVFGDNIGTTITAWLAASSSGNTAKRVAMVHTLFNVFGTIIFGILTYLGIYTLLINWITPGNVYAGQNIARHVANGHTMFNVINMILFLPFANQLANLATKIIPPDKVETISLGEPKHLNYTIISNSDLAINQSIKEMREMLRLVRMELMLAYQAFKEKDYKKQMRVSRIEKAIDNLQREITLYLVAVNEKTNAEDIIHKIPALLHTVNDIEKIGDFTEEINKILNEQIIAKKHHLSPKFISIIDELHSKLLYMLDLSIDYLVELKEDYIYKIIEMEGRINETHHHLREEILSQVQNGKCNAAEGLNTIDYIDEVEEIADKLKNLVKAGTHNFVYNRNFVKETEEEEKTENDKELTDVF
ncbi:MAG TPA: Na/Pi cotransporter family protein [Candidatus Cloacimonas acidaminovorans]|jgi:phosphate:Na+ symporter|nr:Na/Pi cotransporter family protein [Candidatus Cloacimonas acidaminovorans]HRS60473.1 Na/Pi cotransporter family protein [Candidatus Cloacimonas sp.]HOE54902.1 Na/Pi cotransporter family protein [Candidatus Cloacimonas acidaminovorans]HOM78628.1 Na/Pi cotransporter family protein [Candidatus Cloacimonas acidaminovorans]HOS07674.1 Na/Pi cotransporter family protein [Candidatus Cloacimonas acidaminovorans]